MRRKSFLKRLHLRSKASEKLTDHCKWRPLRAVEVRRWTGSQVASWPSVVPALRRRKYWISDFPVTGDAPKDFIHVFERSASRGSPRDWPAHIAKVGHKWYPAESATEQMMTRLGEIFGLRMARSRLMCCDGQIRFLSRYFLRPNESLVHGAEVVAGYLEDKGFVEEVAKEDLEKEIFTFQVVCDAIGALFAENREDLLHNLVRMIGFDALVGNQDRHIYNWGIVVHPTAIRPPRFSPIYDTARAMFWNEAEDRLHRFDESNVLEHYIDRSHPTIGWDQEKNLNHFDLIKKIATTRHEFRIALRSVVSDAALVESMSMIDEEFKHLLSSARRSLIQRCLQLRHRAYKQACEV